VATAPSVVWCVVEYKHDNSRFVGSQVSHVLLFLFVFNGTFLLFVVVWFFFSLLHPSLRAVFRSALAFNQDLSKWDVSGVEYMKQMFAGSGLRQCPFVGGKWEEIQGDQNAFFDFPGTCQPGFKIGHVCADGVNFFCTECEKGLVSGYGSTACAKLSEQFQLDRAGIRGIYGSQNVICPIINS
jgi:hypothetical protein